MECPRCSREAEPDQNFCNGCGFRLAPRGAEPGPEPVQSDGQLSFFDADQTGEVLIWAEDTIDTGEVATVAVLADEAGETGEVPITEAEVVLSSGPLADDTEVTGESDVTTPTGAKLSPGAVEVMTGSTAAGNRSVASGSTTTVRAAGGTAVMPQVDVAPPATSMLPQTGLGRFVGGRRFRLSATSVFGFAVAAAAVVVPFVPLLSVQSSVTVLLDNAAVPDGFRFGTWVIGNLGSNLPVALVLCASLALIGAIATGYGRAWGAGLIAGASLSVVGIVALAVGLLQFPIEAAYLFARIPTEVPIGLRITREPGYWLMLGVAGLAVVATFSSFKECMDDRRRNLNPWFAAFGALSVLLLVVGMMIPLNGALISDNWFVIEGPGQAPQELVAGRLVQLGLILISGVVGFLLVRSYGLGLAVGGTLPALWMGMSVLLNDNNPVGPGWRNPGATTMEVHPVTIIEMAAVLALLVLASLSAYGQRVARGDGNSS